MRKLLGWVRRRLEGIIFALLLFPAGFFARRLCRTITHGAEKDSLKNGAYDRRFQRSLRLHGWRDIRATWWDALSLEPARNVWRQLLVAEVFSRLNGAHPKGRKAGAPSSYRRVMVINLGHIGDLLHTMPMLRALRGALPDAHIALLTGPWNRDLVERIPEVNKVHYYKPRWEAYSRQSKSGCRSIVGEVEFLAELREKKWDLAISCSSGSLVDWALLQALAPDVWIGADTRPASCAVPPCDYRPVSYDSRQYEADRLAALLHATGLGAEKPGVTALEWRVTPEDRQAADTLIGYSPDKARRRLVALAPGAGWPGKMWPWERFAEVGAWAAREMAADIVLIGSRREHDLCERIGAHMKTKVLNLAGQTSIPTLAAVLKRCDVLICNDSGPLHLAAAVGTPTVLIFGPGFPSKWAPRGKEHTLLCHDTGCRCYLWHPRAQCTRNNECIRTVTTEEVQSAVRRQLEAAAA